MLKRNLIANYLGQGWIAVMGLAFVPLYIRYLGIEAYGLIGLFAVLQGWLGLLDMGMTPTLGREMARFSAGVHTAQSIRDLLRSLEVVAYSLALLMVGSLWYAANWLAADWLHTEKLPVAVVAHAIPIMALVIGLRFCEGIYRSAIFGLQKQVWFNAANATLQTLRHAGAVVILLYAAPTIEAFFIWQASISMLTLLILAIKLHNLIPPSPKPARFSKVAIKNVWHFAGGMLGINLLVILLTQVDKLLLSNLLNLQHYGYYMLAGAIAGVMSMTVGPITQTIYPRLVELHAKGDEAALARMFHQGAQLVTLATTPVMLLLVMFPEVVVYVWSGDHELANSTAPILTPLAIGSFLNGLMAMPYQVQLAQGWTSLTIRVNAIAVAILVPAILLLVPIYGAIAAAWIWVVLNGGYVFIAAHFIYKKILMPEKWRWYFQDLIIQIMCGLAVVICLYFITRHLTDSSRIQWVAYLMAVGVLTIAAVLMASSQLRPQLKLFFLKISSQ